MVECGRDSQVRTFHIPCIHHIHSINYLLHTNLMDTILPPILLQGKVLLRCKDDVVACWQRKMD